MTDGQAGSACLKLTVDEDLPVTGGIVPGDRKLVLLSIEKGVRRYIVNMERVSTDFELKEST